MNMHVRGSARWEKKSGEPEFIEIEKALGDLSEAATKSASQASDARKRVEALERRFATIEEGQSDFEKILARLPANGAERKEITIESKAFGSFLRHGPEGLAPEERKSLNVSDSTNGGFLAPDGFVAELLRNVVLFSPVRQVARVGNTAAAAVTLPKRTGQLTATWVSETGQRQRTQPSYGQVRLPVVEAACYVDVSNALLEDAGIDVASELALDFAEEFGRLEGGAMVVGDGVDKPSGFMLDAGVGETISGHATQITGDGMIDLFYALAAPYRARGTWMMNATSLAAVRKIKGTDGHYIWQPALAVGQPETILGRPVVEAPDMPSAGTGLYPVAFGDFQSAYRVYDRVQLSILRDPYSIQTEGQVRFHARRRLAAGVVRAEAIRKLKCAAA